MVFGAGGDLLDGLLRPMASIGDLAYYALIYEYLNDRIQNFGVEMMGRAMTTAGGIALVLMTIWVFFQGLRFVTGQSRESFMAFIITTLRAMLIVVAATSFAATGDSVYRIINDDLKGAITQLVTGEDDDPADLIDRNLAYMQLGLSSIDALQVEGDPNLFQEKNRAMWMVGLGTAGPAMVGGAMLLMYNVMLALFVGLGPIFILCLLFDATKSLFQRWLLYGIGTMFSLAVLAAMIAIATDTVLSVAAAFWTSALLGQLLGSSFTSGMTSVAMQQGGIGLLLTVLLISTPPMVANFFQGALGGFSPFAQISGSHGSIPGGARGGAGGSGGGGGGGSGSGTYYLSKNYNEGATSRSDVAPPPVNMHRSNMPNSSDSVVASNTGSRGVASRTDT
jgi:type IV secretion system protein VirB6